jgi:acyl carrier protein
MTRTDVVAIVKKHILDVAEDLSEEKINPAMSMKELGINSLDIVEVVSCAMRELKVKVPRSELSKLTNIDGLVDLLYSNVLEKERAAAAPES